jgi:hypothetical protein
LLSALPDSAGAGLPQPPPATFSLRQGAVAPWKKFKRKQEIGNG